MPYDNARARLSRACARSFASFIFLGVCLAPAIASAQEPATTEQNPAAVAPATPEEQRAPAAVEPPAPAPAAVEPPAPAPVVAAPSAPPPVTATPAPAEISNRDDVDGPGTHVAMVDAWFGLVPTQATVGNVDYTALGAALGARACLLCLLTADLPITGGDLLGLDVGFGFQSPENKSIGNAWALLRVDLGLQVAARPLKDLELVLRYYVISHWNSARHVGASDDVYVLEPGLRYRQFLVDVAVDAYPFAYPLLSERASTASLVALRGRYLFDMKKGYFAGVAYEKIGSPDTADIGYSSNVLRLMLGQQL